MSDRLHICEFCDETVAALTAERDGQQAAYQSAIEALALVVAERDNYRREAESHRDARQALAREIAEAEAEHARLRAVLGQIRQWLFENQENPLRLMQVDELAVLLRRTP